jgi:predicted amidohydrolase
MVVSVGVNERDGGSLYNTQLLFDADGTLIQRRRKTTPTYHERMIWGQGDGSGLRAVDSAVGRIGQWACWEHYNPLARYALIADGEQIHSAMFPGAFGGDLSPANLNSWLSYTSRAATTTEPTGSAPCAVPSIAAASKVTSSARLSSHTG